MNPKCSKCNRETLPDKMLGIEIETNKVYYFCYSCIKSSVEMMSMKIVLNQEEKSLLKKMRKFIKGKNYGKN